MISCYLAWNSIVVLWRKTKKSRANKRKVEYTEQCTFKGKFNLNLWPMDNCQAYSLAAGCQSQEGEKYIFMLHLFIRSYLYICFYCCLLQDNAFSIYVRWTQESLVDITAYLPIYPYAYVCSVFGFPDSDSSAILHPAHNDLSGAHCTLWHYEKEPWHYTTVVYLPLP